MAEIIENKKGFKVIQLTSLQVMEALGGFGICDRCNSHSDIHFYIPVLHRCYCPKCYDIFTEQAVRYPEDEWYETKKFNEAKTLLKITENENGDI